MLNVMLTNTPVKKMVGEMLIRPEVGKLPIGEMVWICESGIIKCKWRKTTLAFSIGDHYNVSFISY